MAPYRGSFKNVVRNLTWGSFNTKIGNYLAHTFNLLGKVDGVSEMEGLTAIGGITTGDKAFTIGPYSFGPTNYKATWKDHVFVHEYGHYLQHLDWGLLYLPIIGAPSLASSLGVEDTHGKDHLARWFEVDASKRGSHYFNKKYGDESKSYKDEYSKDPYGVDKTKYFSIKSFINGKMSSYVNPRTGKRDQGRAYPTSPTLDFFDFFIPATLFAPLGFIVL